MSLFPSLDNIPEDPKVEDLKDLHGSLNLTFSTVEYMFETFLKGLDGVLTNEQIEYEIRNYYDKYCDYDNFQSESTRKIFQEIWKNERFLILFKRCIPYIHLTKYHNKVICKIAYDYYTSYTSETRNEAVTILLFQIVEEINSKSIIPLTTIMDKQSALFIVMSRYSSFELEDCVRRVNEFIIRLGYDFTVDQIIYIYSRLYCDGFGQPFNYIMTHTYKFESGDLSNQEYTIYNRINRALLVILNSMPTADIERVLTGYENYIEMHPDKITRFNISQKATVDYDRLRKVITMNDYTL